ncbi:endonuclease/exonuclease/phosphatase family protein [Frankia sp. AgB1.9]|uniref:endonuclease/exonuclease/phosphatase family protein n=1 Tax=unclassified Frankia TaxID=2632575 RepID=UPI001932144B|nr:MULTISPECIES: endonuclease/exonuclease/phosphatase family protein [unclassified Frankia]MBL7489635.1 endonuclease/exonuclease/phosphatase family protein [Frankia sp. AgW1.1]MBL7547342.1 endonuclease/exonuclease/phosphatase family protein [Frankia sp. AgB1.9]MBL7618741.1 endonuclease/exonuclease/phosphatase family protein [Frankia sp. AgB1.8]
MKPEGSEPVLLSLATLNTRGVPLTGTRRTERFAAIGVELESSAVEVVGLQEVYTYHHLKLLKTHLPAFPHVAFARTPVGPAGGVATFSRVPFTEKRFERFGRPREASGVRWRTRIMAGLNGNLITRVAGYDLYIVNTHPIANMDGDWSETNRFYALQRSQYAALTRLVGRLGPRVAVIGDFNAPRVSAVHTALMADTGLRDTFGQQCPPTFHAEYLSGGREPQCIDFILASEPLAVKRAELLLAEKVSMPGGAGFASDHVGLRADLLVPV